MYLLEEATVHCPYCAEALVIDIDCSVPEQRYIEDCQVCCRPISVSVVVGSDGDPQVDVRDENES